MQFHYKNALANRQVNIPSLDEVLILNLEYRNALLSLRQQLASVWVANQHQQKALQLETDVLTDKEQRELYSDKASKEPPTISMLQWAESAGNF